MVGAPEMNGRLTTITSATATSAASIEEIRSGMEFPAFGTFLRALISDEQPSDEDLRRVFDTFDKDRDGVLKGREAEEVNRRIVQTLKTMRAALIVVDFQNDFVDGSLAIKRGRAQQDPMEALPILNRLLIRSPDFDSVVYTLDWHPSNHISFYEHCRNEDRQMQKADKSRKLKPFDVVTFEEPKCRQVLYPSHCVKDSWGADLNAELRRVSGAKYVRKGTDIYVDAYSGFADNNGKIKSELESILRADRINAIFICGLALDICVASTARDGAKLKFFTSVIHDCCKGLSDDQIKRTRAELRGRNVPYIQSEHVNAYLDAPRRVPWLWLCQMAGLGEKRHRRRRRGAADASVSPMPGSEGQRPASHGTDSAIQQGAFDTVARRSESEDEEEE